MRKSLALCGGTHGTSKVERRAAHYSRIKRWWIKMCLSSQRMFHVWKNSKLLWRVAPLLLFWVLWKDRNLIIFKTKFFANRLKSTLIHSPFFWAYNVKRTDRSFMRTMFYRHYGYAQGVFLWVGVLLSYPFFFLPSWAYLYSPIIL